DLAAERDEVQLSGCVLAERDEPVARVGADRERLSSHVLGLAGAHAQAPDGAAAGVAVEVAPGHGAALVVTVLGDRLHQAPRPERLARVRRRSLVDAPAEVEQPARAGT